MDPNFSIYFVANILLKKVKQILFISLAFSIFTFTCNYFFFKDEYVVKSYVSNISYSELKNIFKLDQLIKYDQNIIENINIYLEDDKYIIDPLIKYEYIDFFNEEYIEKTITHFLKEYYDLKPFIKTFMNEFYEDIYTKKEILSLVNSTFESINIKSNKEQDNLYELKINFNNIDIIDKFLPSFEKHLNKVLIENMDDYYNNKLNQLRFNNSLNTSIIDDYLKAIVEKYAAENLLTKVKLENNISIARSLNLDTPIYFESDNITSATLDIDINKTKVINEFSYLNGYIALETMLQNLEKENSLYASEKFININMVKQLLENALNLLDSEDKINLYNESYSENKIIKIHFYNTLISYNKNNQIYFHIIFGIILGILLSLYYLFMFGFNRFKDLNKLQVK